MAPHLKGNCVSNDCIEITFNHDWNQGVVGKETQYSIDYLKKCLFSLVTFLFFLLFITTPRLMRINDALSKWQFKELLLISNKLTLRCQWSYENVKFEISVVIRPHESHFSEIQWRITSELPFWVSFWYLKNFPKLRGMFRLEKCY